jgi:DNA-binding CsgD family transcriptional regulator
LVGSHYPIRQAAETAEESPGQRGRLPGVSTECQYFLQIAAVVGATFVLGEVAHLLQRPVAALLPVINEALSNGLLCPDPQAPEAMSFRDAEVQREVLARIPSPVLRTLRQEARAVQTRIPAQALPLHDTPALDGEEPQLDCLTETERAIASLVGKGMTNRQVANRVCLSPHTVNYHLRRIFRKLDIRSRVELARIMPERT